jgi:hypothetical protein
MSLRDGTVPGMARALPQKAMVRSDIFEHLPDTCWKQRLVNELLPLASPAIPRVSP